MSLSGGGYREYSALVGGKERSVRVEPDGEGLRVRVESEEFLVRCETRADGEFFLLLNGRPQVVNVRGEAEGRYRIMLGGIERSVRIQDPIASRVGHASQTIRSDRTIEVRSPMHGTVVDVQIEENEEVEEESPLVVLEAMKMQNALTSPIRGRVRRILVRPGETVEGDALLVVLDRVEAMNGTGTAGDDRVEKGKNDDNETGESR
jgi:biotin carboxyl carrier protein